MALHKAPWQERLQCAAHHFAAKATAQSLSLTDPSSTVLHLLRTDPAVSELPLVQALWKEVQVAVEQDPEASSSTISKRLLSILESSHPREADVRALSENGAEKSRSGHEGFSENRYRSDDDEGEGFEGSHALPIAGGSVLDAPGRSSEILFSSMWGGMGVEMDPEESVQDVDERLQQLAHCLQGAEWAEAVESLNRLHVDDILSSSALEDVMQSLVYLLPLESPATPRVPFSTDEPILSLLTNLLKVRRALFSPIA